MNWLFELRKELHRHPELAFEENQTAQILKKELQKRMQQHIDLQAIRQGACEPIIHNFEHSPGFLVEYTACDGTYRLFRADMDALPLLENTGSGFASQNPGIMHACGHDIHMSVLMGLIDSILKEQPRQNLLFLFQPAEEGKGGAQSVLAEGIIQQFNIQSVFALHVASKMPVGTIGSRPGIFFGIPQEYDVHFAGKSAHVAFPEQGKDAIAAAVEFSRLMQRDIRHLEQTHRIIFHIGKITGGSARNVIADTCSLEGTHRSLSTEARDQMNHLIHQNAKAAAELVGAQYQAELLCSYEPVVNDVALVAALKDAAGKLDYSYEDSPIAMTGEDFGFFTSRYPGLLFWLGSGSAQALHSPEFLPDEACIKVGIEIMKELAVCSLGQQ